MEFVYLVMLLALIEYMVFGALVGRARMVHGIKAPATTGNAEFERTFRAHQNTLESLIIFVPAIWIFATYVSAVWAAVLGAAYIIGRALYVRGYISQADKRGMGGMIGYVANAALVLGGLIGVIWRLL